MLQAARTPEVRTFCLLLITAGLLTCSSCAINSSSNPAPESVLATIHRTGGLLGADQTITYLRDGHYDIRWDSGNDAGRHEKGATPPDILTKLQQALGQTAALTETSYPPPPRSADAYRFQMEQAGRTFTWSNVSPGLPAPLSNLSGLFTLTAMLGQARSG